MLISLYTNYFYAFKFKIIFATIFSYTYIHNIKRITLKELNVKQVLLFPSFNWYIDYCFTYNVIVCAYLS